MSAATTPVGAGLARAARTAGRGGHAARLSGARGRAYAADMGLPLRLLAVPLALAAVTALAPAPARACGGFFCDSVNGVPTPVDQTGENILFVLDREAGTVEAHIQIEYTGDPQKFAWLIPVTAIPDFAVGSEPLISNLLAGTAPVYGFSAVRDCADDDRPRDNIGCSAVSLDAGGGREEGGDEGDSAGGPEVVKRAVVGAFELVVLQGGTSQEVYDWLLAGGFYQDMAALPILDEYLAEDFYFVAIKLRHDAGVDEIHPIVMTYEGDQPCVPLRLTRIAAVEDMGVRVFSLADERTVPINYRHVELNEVRLDWRSSADNYREVVARAIDAPGADGHAFITEYAGPTAVVSPLNIWDPAWSWADFEDAVPTGGGPEVMTLLADQGLVDCSVGPCVYNHPMVLPLLRAYLPAPAGAEEDSYYACIECWAEQADFSLWDGVAFARDFRERIDDPGRHAAGLLNAYPYLTRLLTVISPEEMTVDPEFVQNPDLPEVGTGHSAVLNNPCEGSNKMVLPDEQAVLLTEDDTWPEFDASMPYAARVEQMTPSGAPQELAEFSEEITAALKASNKQYSYDNGRGIGCVVGRNFGRNNAGGVLMLGVIFIVAWRGRRRR